MSKEGSVSGKAFDLRLFRRIFAYVSPYRKVFAFCVLFTVSLSFLGFLRPILVMYILNHTVVTPDQPLLIKLTLLLTGLLVTESIVHFLNSYYTSWLGQHIIRDMRIQLFTHIQKLRSSYFDHTPIGMLVTRVVSDIEAIEEIFSQGFIVIAGDILTLVVFVTGMFIIDWQLSLIVLSTLPFLLFATWLFKNAVKSAFSEVRTQVARLNAYVQEHITGMKIVQIFNREEQEMEGFRKINARHRDANIRSVWHYSVFFPVVEILSSVSIGLLAWYAGKDVFAGRIGPGEITFFVMLVSMFFRPVRMLADRVNTLQMGMVASERVFKVLDTDQFIPDTGSIDAGRLKGEVEFKNVWFAYSGDNHVLKGISFRAKAGESIALVGATGSGKTSVINLLNRFYEYNSGEILVDGRNIRDYSLTSLRKNTGLVLQDVFLFSDSIFNNITLHSPDIGLEKVTEAAQKVGAHEFIMRLPGNYDFNVMERGTMISAGQRQLIAFIRAYVFNPSLLILDEATSNIDTETEQLIQQATARITQGRTSFIIAHRLATIQKADRILVMDQGRIAEEGNHQELLKKDGKYRKLFELQFKGETVSG